MVASTSPVRLPVLETRCSQSSSASDPSKMTEPIDGGASPAFSVTVIRLLVIDDAVDGHLPLSFGTSCGFVEHKEHGTGGGSQTLVPGLEELIQCTFVLG
jgi:hypothetical protein